MDLNSIHKCKTCEKVTHHATSVGKTPANIKVTCGSCGTEEELPPLYAPMMVTATFLKNDAT